MIAANRLHGIRLRSCPVPPYHKSEPLPMIMVPIFIITARDAGEDPLGANRAFVV
jgi:hypothetical protein